MWDAQYRLHDTRSKAKWIIYRKSKSISVRKVVNNGAIDKANNLTSSVVENMSHEILSWQEVILATVDFHTSSVVENMSHEILSWQETILATVDFWIKFPNIYS